MTVQRPQTTAQLIDLVHRCQTDRGSYRLQGAGSWLSGGRPCAATDVLSTEAFTGVTEYVPGDLVITARAGTTVAEIADVTRSKRQWLALDPYGADAGTVGATIATASAGPLAAAYGHARDMVTGVSAVTGTGRHVQAGGRVVKNVAGFDLVRLITGSWGTLGVITDVTLKLHAMPQNEVTLALEVEPELLAAQLNAVRRLPFVPMAAQLVDAESARYIEGTGSGDPAIGGNYSERTPNPGGQLASTLYLRIGGNASLLHEQRAHLARMSATREVAGTVWTRLRNMENVCDMNSVGNRALSDWNVVRASAGLSRVSDILRTAISAYGTSPHPPLRYSAAVTSGVVRIFAPPVHSVAVITALRAANIRVVAERLNDAAWGLFPPPADLLSLRIRESFDPGCMFNPGLMGNPIPQTAP